MRRNIELKARCSDLARAAAACERLGAQRAWTRRQTDIYFLVPDCRLKLRMEEPLTGRGPGPGEAVLVWYRRANAPGARESLYEVTPVCDAAATAASLAAQHGTGARVVKTRTLYLLGNVRIHLDDVEGLGTFVEFEAVMDGAGGGDDAALELLGRLRGALGIDEGDLVSQSYGDMLVATR